MKITLRPFGIDFRSDDLKARGARLEQALGDLRLELDWARKVRVNIFRRQIGAELLMLKKQTS